MSSAVAPVRTGGPQPRWDGRPVVVLQPLWSIRRRHVDLLRVSSAFCRR